MREIKFRGKTVSTKEWFYGDLVHNAFSGHRIFPVGIQIPGCYPDEVIAETVGQFTGLHDKNGKEIYEGDIVRDYDEGFLYKVMFCEHYAQFMFYDYLNDDYYDNQDIAEHEIIGNIHENPELLEGRE